MMPETQYKKNSNGRAQPVKKAKKKVAMAVRPDAPLFAVLVRAAEQLMGTFNSQNLANTAWALAVATAGQSDVVDFRNL